MWSVTCPMLWLFSQSWSILQRIHGSTHVNTTWVVAFCCNFPVHLDSSCCWQNFPSVNRRNEDIWVFFYVSLTVRKTARWSVQRNLLVFMSPFSANQHTLKGNNITILKIKTLLRIFIKLELPLELQYFEFACHHFSFKKEFFLWTTCSKKP